MTTHGAAINTTEIGESTKEIGDLISCLPECLLLHILSFLEMKDAVRTGVLSRRWIDLWTLIPNLNFCGPTKLFSFDSLTIGPSLKLLLMSDFVQFVDQSLNLYRGLNVQKFRLHCMYQKSYSSNIDTWISFAIRKKAQELYLEFKEDDIFGQFFDEACDKCILPPSLFQCGSLTALKLRLCFIQLPDVVCLRSLKTLSLSKINIEDDVISIVIIGCPLLEDLEMIKCDGRSFLHISSSNLQLRHLKIHDCCFHGMEIDVPSLLSLDLSGRIFHADYSLNNLSSLVDAYLNFDGDGYESGSYNHNLSSSVNGYLNFDGDGYESGTYNHILEKILEGLSHAKVLKLCDWCIKVLSILELEKHPSQVYNCKCLILTTELQKWDLQAIVRLVRESPALETLTINISSTCFVDVDPRSTYYNFKEDEYLQSLQAHFPCLESCLKTVNICGFMGGDRVPTTHERTMQHLRIKLKRELLLVSFLLSKALVLEKMAFRIPERHFFERLKNFLFLRNKRFEIDRILLNGRRASPHAEILFSYD